MPMKNPPHPGAYCGIPSRRLAEIVHLLSGGDAHLLKRRSKSQDANDRNLQESLGDILAPSLVSPLAPRCSSSQKGAPQCPKQIIVE